jgi:hypothetical protein
MSQPNQTEGVSNRVLPKTDTLHIIIATKLQSQNLRITTFLNELI